MTLQFRGRFADLCVSSNAVHGVVSAVIHSGGILVHFGRTNASVELPLPSHAHQLITLSDSMLFHLADNTLAAYNLTDLTKAPALTALPVTHAPSLWQHCFLRVLPDGCVAAVVSSARDALVCRLDRSGTTVLHSTTVQCRLLGSSYCPFELYETYIVARLAPQDYYAPPQLLFVSLYGEAALTRGYEGPALSVRSCVDLVSIVCVCV